MSTTLDLPESAPSSHLPPPSCAWHAWRQPVVSLARVYACGVYCVPRGQPPTRGWAAKCAELLAACKSFHEAQFPGSQLEWALHGPLFLPADAKRHRGDPDGFYTSMSDTVIAAARSNELPLVCLASSTTTDGTKASFEPTIADFVCFADWGQQLISSPDDLKKYFIYAAAANRPGGASIDISDITMAGGSRSSFRGRVPRRALRGLSCWPSAERAILDSAYWSRSVGLGVGLVTQEAWLHPEVRVRPRPTTPQSSAASNVPHPSLPFYRYFNNAFHHRQALGSDAVTYHEGLGHALAMPHPSTRQKWCVMDMGMYQNVPLIQLEVCAELKADMGAAAFAVAADTGESNHFSREARLCRIAASVAAAARIGLRVPVADVVLNPAHVSLGSSSTGTILDKPRLRGGSVAAAPPPSSPAALASPLASTYSSRLRVAVVARLLAAKLAHGRFLLACDSSTSSSSSSIVVLAWAPQAHIDAIDADGGESASEVSALLREAPLVVPTPSTHSGCPACMPSQPPRDGAYAEIENTDAGTSADEVVVHSGVNATSGTSVVSDATSSDVAASVSPGTADGASSTNIADTTMNYVDAVALSPASVIAPQTSAAHAVPPEVDVASVEVATAAAAAVAALGEELNSLQATTTPSADTSTAAPVAATQDAALACHAATPASEEECVGFVVPTSMQDDGNSHDEAGSAATADTHGDDDDDDDDLALALALSVDSDAPTSAAGNGQAPHAAVVVPPPHGWPPSTPYTLGATWTEAQFAAEEGPWCEGNVALTVEAGDLSRMPSTIRLYSIGEYHFREVLWMPTLEAEATTANGAPQAAESPTLFELCGECLARLCRGNGGVSQSSTASGTVSVAPLTLFDVGRNIAIVVSADTACISMNGLHGKYTPWCNGQWSSASDVCR